MHRATELKMKYLFRDIVHNSFWGEPASILSHHKCHRYLPRFFIQGTGGKQNGTLSRDHNKLLAKFQALRTPLNTRY